MRRTTEVLYRWSTSGGMRVLSICQASASRRKSRWRVSRFSATVSSLVIWVMPVNGRKVCGPTRRHQGLREAQAVGDGDVVVGETVDQHKRALEFRCVLHDAVSVVDIRVEAQIALGVVRVVQRPVGGRGGRRMRP